MSTLEWALLILVLWTLLPLPLAIAIGRAFKAGHDDA